MIKLPLDNFNTSNYTMNMSKLQDLKRPQEDEMTTGQTADMFDVSIQTIHNWINAGRLEAREVWRGRKRMRYIKRESADRWQVHMLTIRGE